MRTGRTIGAYPRQAVPELTHGGEHEGCGPRNEQQAIEGLDTGYKANVVASINYNFIPVLSARYILECAALLTATLNGRFYFIVKTRVLCPTPQR